MRIRSKIDILDSTAGFRAGRGYHGLVMKTKVVQNGVDEAALEPYRPAHDVEWVMIASGEWSQDDYHSGWAAYHVAKIGQGKWVLDCVQWNGCLDDVTQADVDNDRLNDDQIQAMWGMTLEKAKAQVYKYIAVVAEEVPADLDAKTVGELLYQKALKAGGFDVG